MTDCVENKEKEIGGHQVSIICPLCNGMRSIHQLCPQCGISMEDGGSLESYYGPYSPYEEQLINSTDDDRKCTHLIYCPNCGKDYRAEIVQVST